MLLCCCLSVTIAIASIVRSRSGCSCSCCCGVPITIAIVKLCSSCTWKEETVGNALDSGRVDIVVDDKGLLLVRILHNCHGVVCAPGFTLPLSDRVLFVVVVAAAAAVVFWL